MTRYKQLVVNTFILMFLLIFFSCKSDGTGKENKPVKPGKKSLEQINKLLIEKDSERIKSYVSRRGWDMKVSESGLWYMVYKNGEGDFIKKGDFITYNYEVSLLDGTICYTSKGSGPKSFVVGKGGVEAGLEEGVLMLRSGSKARFILPPHLAYGLIGDENRIPARAIIIYDMEILKINE